MASWGRLYHIFMGIIQKQQNKIELIARAKRIVA
jgi:hypothetical protein